MNLYYTNGLIYGISHFLNTFPVLQKFILMLLCPLNHKGH